MRDILALIAGFEELPGKYSDIDKHISSSRRTTTPRRKPTHPSGAYLVLADKLHTISSSAHLLILISTHDTSHAAMMTPPTYPGMDVSLPPHVAAINFSCVGRRDIRHGAIIVVLHASRYIWYHLYAIIYLLMPMFHSELMNIIIIAQPKLPKYLLIYTDGYWLIFSSLVSIFLIDMLVGIRSHFILMDIFILALSAWYWCRHDVMQKPLFYATIFHWIYATAPASHKSSWWCLYASLRAGLPTWRVDIQT